MIVRLEQDPSVEETEVLIRYAVMTSDVERVATMLQAAGTRIVCSYEGKEVLIGVSDIYYFESVDKMTFVYCEQQVYRTELRLYQIVEDLARFGFIQISKSVVLNINVLESITPLFNSRMEATLRNTERVFVTRRYLENIKKALQEGV